MEHSVLISELQVNQNIIRDLLYGLDNDFYLWRSQPDKWNLLDIVCHLVDEEREDFRYRLKHVLETPQKEMPSINPVTWVTDRKYQEQDYDKTLRKFITERAASLDWLNSLPNPKWDHFYSHPKLGKLSASMFLHNWVAHDYLHIRQILNIKYNYLKFNSTEPLNYAGEW